MDPFTASLLAAAFSAAIGQAVPKYGQTQPNMSPAQQGQGQQMDLNQLIQQGQQPSKLPQLQLQNRLPQTTY